MEEQELVRRQNHFDFDVDLVNDAEWCVAAGHCTRHITQLSFLQLQRERPRLYQLCVYLFWSLLGFCC